MNNVDKAWLPDYQVLGDIQNLDNNTVTITKNNHTYTSTNYTILRYTWVRDKDNKPVYAGDKLYTDNDTYIGTVEETESGFRITTPILTPNLNILKAKNYYVKSKYNETL